MVTTSDVHISNPGGRWPHTTHQFELLLNSVGEGVATVFLVGDVIDNVKTAPGGIQTGDLPYLRSEFEIYQKLVQSHSLEILHTYGPGHDFTTGIPLATAESLTGQPHRGKTKWGKVELVWLTVYPAVFSNTGANPPALYEEDYSWLESTLAGTDNVILLWHVPIRTEDTFTAGKWSRDRNLTIPHSDRLYSIIDKHAPKIKAIFNGHIHKPIKSLYRDIPVYLCPMFRTGCYCELRQARDTVTVTPINCGIPGTEIAL